MNALLIEVRSESVRAARIEQGAVVELQVFPKDGREGALYRARVTKVEKAADGAFLDLGGGEAFLPRRRAKAISRALREGELLVVELLREPEEEEKLPLARLVAPDASGAPGLERPAPEPLAKALALAGAGDDILVDDRLAHLRAGRILPGRAKLYSDRTPLFEAFGVEEKIAEALAGTLGLPGGASLAIESTKGATVIDVNGGPQSPLDANLAAAAAIPGALRFQNIGGLIVVDFIGLKRASERARVLKVLDAGLTKDPAPVERTGFNRFGQLSLKRARKGVSLRARLKGRQA